MTDDAPLRIRISADAAELAVLRRAWSSETAGQTLSDDGFEDRFAAWFAAEADHRVAFVADWAGAAVGMMNLAVFTRMPRPEAPASCWCYLANAFILAAFRNRGIGSALLGAAQDHARELGAVRIMLSPSPRSVPFYQRAGFGPADLLMAQEL